MKEFNLDRALAGDPVVTRTGLQVSEIFHFITLKDRFPVRAVVEGILMSYTIEGTQQFQNVETPYDLFMAPVKKQVWLNIYKDNSITGYCVDGPFPSEKSAMHTLDNDFVKSVLIREWEE